MERTWLRILLVDFDDVAVAEDFGLVNVLASETTVALGPGELHFVRQLAVNEPREIGNG